MEITEELILSLESDTITHKRYKDVVEEINKKIDEIWNFIINESGRKMDWYTIMNDSFFENKFNPFYHKEFIKIGGNFSHHDIESYEYNKGFPTNFLWSDYKSIVKKHLQEIKEKHENNKQDVFKKRVLIESIKSKLTKEELNLIILK